MNKFTYLCHNICPVEFPIIHSEYALLNNLYHDLQAEWLKGVDKTLRNRKPFSKTANIILASTIVIII